MSSTCVRCRRVDSGLVSLVVVVCMRKKTFRCDSGRGYCLITSLDQEDFGLLGSNALLHHHGPIDMMLS